MAGLGTGLGVSFASTARLSASTGGFLLPGVLGNLSTQDEKDIITQQGSNQTLSATEQVVFDSAFLGTLGLTGFLTAQNGDLIITQTGDFRIATTDGDLLVFPSGADGYLITQSGPDGSLLLTTQDGKAIYSQTGI